MYVHDHLAIRPSLKKLWAFFNTNVIICLNKIKYLKMIFILIKKKKIEFFVFKVFLKLYSQRYGYYYYFFLLFFLFNNLLLYFYVIYSIFHDDAILLWITICHKCSRKYKLPSNIEVSQSRITNCRRKRKNSDVYLLPKIVTHNSRTATRLRRLSFFPKIFTFRAGNHAIERKIERQWRKER